MNQTVFVSCKAFEDSKQYKRKASEMTERPAKSQRSPSLDRVKFLALLVLSRTR